jgi:urea transport system ATP-binding protein
VTPDLMEEGARRREAYAAKQAAARQTESGGRQAAFSRVARAGEPDFAHGVALYLDDITVSFDGFKALNALTLTVNVGELRCIIGPNGAGKTTMMDCITGKTRPDAGRAFFGSTIDLLGMSEPQISQVGIGRKFQKPTVYEQLSVFEKDRKSVV